MPLFWISGVNQATQDTLHNAQLKGGFKGKTRDRWNLLNIYKVTTIKIAVIPLFCMVLDSRVNVYRRQSGWYLMRPYRKRAKFSYYDDIFKIYLTRMKKESPRIISDKLNPGNKKYLDIRHERFNFIIIESGFIPSCYLYE